MSSVLKLNLAQKYRKPKIILAPDDFNVDGDSSDPMDILMIEKENSYSEGLENGYRKAKEELEQEYINKAINRSEEFYNVLSSFENQINNYSEAFDQIVIALSVKIAEKIIRKKIENNGTIEEVLQESLKKIIGANKVIVKINEKDYEFLENESKIDNYLKSFQKIVFEKDESIKQGGCFIDTEIGNVDARIETQLKELQKKISLTMETEEEL
ncbi:MAG: hypothetical protein K9J16_02320 [Melioribacteraceae bacterium]|nr:hypothetical protein [Melioribacteraceae bacterium]MCF8353733.1 hypothetical protein [Melioribacteraceae bacterium]MCF8392458.1 hypothetical protein [Melioribacteraceae bacterium]MCF8418369.1 hypothetical protein [Melioribacteraceae bacterium]